MRIVIKIGTNTLAKGKGMNVSLIQSIAKEIATLQKQGNEILIVSSGAIGFGAMKLNQSRSREIPVRQAHAAIGQPLQMSQYAQSFSKYDIAVAQLLLTYDLLNNRSTYLRMRKCIEILLKQKVVPIINENDPISIEEIDAAFGDNDKLSALVAAKMNADLLILLSDVDGLYTDNPAKSKSAKKISVVTQITPQIRKYAGKANSLFAVGGMKTKIDAAELAMDSGCSLVIAKGDEKNIISKIVSGEQVGTRFISDKKMSAKKRWIMSAKPKGSIQLNTCAIDVLKEGKASVLAIGIDAVKGTFDAGDVIDVLPIGKGVAGYSSKKLDSIKGLTTQQASKKAKEKIKEVVKKENLILKN